MRQSAFVLAGLLLACGGGDNPLLPGGQVPQLRFWSGPGELRPVTLATQADGQLLVVGTFSERVRYQSVELEARSGSDLFVFALNSGGGIRWARSFDQSLFRFEGIRATARASGGWWLAGRSIDGPVTLDAFEVPQSNLPQGLIIHLDDAGVVQRGRSIASSQGSRISALSATADSVVIAGRFSGDFQWGGQSLSSSDSDVFAAVLDDQLEYLRQDQLQGPGFDVVAATAIDAGEIMVAGRFQQALGSLAAEGLDDGYVWRPLQDELESWGGPGDGEAVTLLAPDPESTGLPWVSGRVSSPLNADPEGTAGTTRDDVFVGRGSRFVRLRGPGLQRAVGLVDLEDGAVLVGTHQDGAEAGGQRLGPAGGDSLFVLRLDEQGGARSLASWFEGSDPHRAAAVAAGPRQWHVLGGFDGSLRLGGEMRRASGNRDVFLVSVPR